MEITSTEYHDANAEDYDSGYEAPFWSLYNEITWSYIQDCLPTCKEGVSILDAGGGTGLWAIKLARLGFNVILTDVSEGMLEVARKKVEKEGLCDLVTIVEQDICDMSAFEDEMFDLCLAEGDPVSYCDDPAKAISELSRVAKPGAFVTVSADNKLTWASHFIGQGKFDIVEDALDRNIGYMPVEPGEFDGDVYPAHLFTIEELKELFAAHGLRPVREVGKPVLVKNAACLEDGEIYQRYLDFELRYSGLPSIAGCGGHIAVVGQKE